MTSGAALTGKRAGVLVLNNLPFVCTRLWIELDRRQFFEGVNFVEIPNPQMADALIGDRVDIVASIDPFFSVALQGSPDKIEVASYAYSKMLPDTIIGCAMMTQEFTAKNGDLVHAFARGCDNAIDWMKQI